jgi:hypothetical protein
LLATAHPIAARALLGRFTSLGDNCEFGLAQRRAGAEPLGLFRLASSGLEGLIAGLADGFADLDPPTRLDVVQPWGDEFITYFGDRGFYHHTLLGSADTDAAALRRAEAARVPFLRGRLLEELASGETIFVRKSEHPDAAGMLALHTALRAYHPANRLLWVEQAADRAGDVECVAPGLYRGWLDRFAPYGDAVALHFDAWLRLCARVLALEGEALPDAVVPPAARIGLDVPMGGWDGVTCTPGGPPPLRAGGQVFTHATDAARQCCGAVLNPRPALEVGASYVAALYVWVPADFAGTLIAPVLTHVERAQRLYAVLQDRERWQRLWVGAAIPPGLAGVDFALWLELAAGDRFYTTEWSIAPGVAPGDYLLA